jgi:hypothetical protein
MTDMVQALLNAGVLPATSFPPTSRYHGIATAKLETAAGRVIVYLRRRFVPPPERFAFLQEHRVQQADRLDNITARYLGDPEQFWRLCDANGVLRPEGLIETIGNRIRITLPEGIPAASDG